MTEFDTIVQQLNPENYVHSRSSQVVDHLYPRGINRDDTWSIDTKALTFSADKRAYISGIFMPFNSGTILRTSNVTIQHDGHNGFIITSGEYVNTIRSDLSMNVMSIAESSVGIEVSINKDKIKIPAAGTAVGVVEVCPGAGAKFCLYDKIVYSTYVDRIPSYEQYRSLFRNVDIQTMRREGGGSLLSNFQWSETQLLTIDDFEKVGDLFATYIHRDGSNKVIRDYTGELRYRFNLEDEDQLVGSRLYMDDAQTGVYLQSPSAEINATVEEETINDIPIYNGKVSFPDGIFPFHRKDTTYYTNVGSRVNGSLRLEISDPSVFEGEVVYLELFGRVDPEIMQIVSGDHYINGHLNPGVEFINSRVFNYYLFEINVDTIPELITSIKSLNWIGLVTNVPNIKSWAGIRRKLATDIIGPINIGTAVNSDKEYSILNIQW